MLYPIKDYKLKDTKKFLLKDIPYPSNPPKKHRVVLDDGLIIWTDYPEKVFWSKTATVITDRHALIDFSLKDYCKFPNKE